MANTCGIMYSVEVTGRFYLPTYISPRRRLVSSTNILANSWADVLGEVMDTHICSTCKQEKPINEFYKRSDGRALSQCAECERKSILSRSYPPKMDGTLKCTTCGEEKKVTDFGLAKHHSTGRKSQCKKCEYAVQAKRRQGMNYPPKMEGTKICCVCKEEKSILEFHTLKTNKDGRMGACKKCDSMCKRISVLKNTYGMSVEEFESLYKDSKGKCKICGDPLDKWLNKLCIDHDHSTGKVRGILCRHCNLLIGNAKDNIDILKSAIEYLTSV